ANPLKRVYPPGELAGGCIPLLISPGVTLAAPLPKPDTGPCGLRKAFSPDRVISAPFKVSHILVLRGCHRPSACAEDFGCAMLSHVPRAAALTSLPGLSLPSFIWALSTRMLAASFFDT